MVEREHVEFLAESVMLRGFFYPASDVKGAAPAVVMAHGFAGTKEMGLEEYAECFQRNGLSVLIYDHRNTGESEGSPRFDLDPVAQWRDYSHAVSYMQLRDDVDENRIGAWGTSYSGGSVIAAAALDRRIKCIVSQVPLISGYENILQLMPLQELDGVIAMLNEDKLSRAKGNAPTMMPICGREGDPCIFPGERTYDYYHEQAQKNPNVQWENLVTLRSLEYVLEYDVSSYLSRVSPTPALMIVASEDRSTPSDLALRAYERMLQPKDLLIVQGDHYRSYIEEFDTTSHAACDWFVKHL